MIIDPTNPDFWDCDCYDNFIHRKSDSLYCPICETFEADQPDSMSDEVHAFEDHYEQRIAKSIYKFARANNLDAFFGKSDDGFITVRFGTTPKD